MKIGKLLKYVMQENQVGISEDGIRLFFGSVKDARKRKRLMDLKIDAIYTDDVLDDISEASSLIIIVKC